MRKRLNATSVMVAAPSFNRSEAQALDILNSVERRVTVGLHLTLTSPFGPLSPGFEPTRDGTFLSLGAMMRGAFMRRLRPDLLKGEIEAQIAAFADTFKRPPAFIDGHRHVHLLPQVREAVIAAVKRAAPKAWLRQCASVQPFWQRLSDRKGFLIDLFSRGFKRAAKVHGISTNPAFAGTYDYRPNADFAQLFPRFLPSMPDGGVIMCHPGRVDAELERLDPLTILREREYAYFLGEDFPRVLARHRIALA
jgi:predicted glycoside hydrolase/deacetylase ChbG (UPF0249 family)